MLISTIELYAEALNLGVTIDTTETHHLSYNFWRQKMSGKKQHFKDVPSKTFHVDVIVPFKRACHKDLNGHTHDHFSDLLFQITGSKQKLSDTDIEEFRDLIDALVGISVSFNNNKLPWHD